MSRLAVTGNPRAMMKTLLSFYESIRRHSAAGTRPEGAFGSRVVPTAEPAPTQDTEEPKRAPTDDFYTVQEGAWIAFPLRSADNREWRVQVEWDALERLGSRGRMTAPEVERALLANIHHLEIAALRAVARGENQGDLILLNATSLRL